MKKQLLLLGILSILGLSLLMPAPATFASPLVAYDPDQRAHTDEEGHDGEEAATPSDGYDACNNVLPGGATPPGFCDEKGQDDLIATVKNILNAVYFWIGILAVVFIIIGGVNYTISQGDPGKVAKAKSTIMYAVIGLIVSLLAFAITEFVLNALGGNI